MPTRKGDEDLRDEARRNAALHNVPPSLYTTTPSFSTLDDPMSPARKTQQQELRRPYEAQTPTKYRKPLDTNATPRRINASTAVAPTSRRHPSLVAGAATTAKTAPKQQTMTSAQNPHVKTTATSRSPAVVASSRQNAASPASAATTTTTATGGPSTTQHRDFQRSCDFPSVTVRYVNVAQRSAFDVKELTSLPEWESIAAASTKNNKKLPRLSPSYNHLAWLHKLQHGQHVIRQVQFSPSTGMDADYFYSLQEVTQGNADEVLLFGPKNSTTTSRRRHSSNTDVLVVRDGRYRSIDPVAATEALLSSPPPGDDSTTTTTTTTSMTPPPSLSHKKYRLPNRADVGFPNASPQEIQCKQDEIRNETAWEEASPRLVLLVTSDDLGTAVFAEQNIKNSATAGPEHETGCEGIPYAGRDLLLAKARNAKHFKRQCHILNNNNAAQLLLRPDSYSMLAPPLESTYSPSQGWRPRPFHDRPAGMQYCLACPMSVSIEPPQDGLSSSRHNEKELPLTCSLTLYTLPPLYNNHVATMTSAAAAAAYHCKKKGALLQQPPAYGKLSEEFWFPAGDWNGKVRLQAVQTPNGEVDAELLQSWMARKHKAIFSYDPLDLAMESNKIISGSGNGPTSLYVVLQIYKTVHCLEDIKADELATTRQLLSPVAFGVTKFFSAKEDMQWPEGQVKEVQLYAYPDGPESSQGSFVERLWSIVHPKSSTTTASSGAAAAAAAVDDSSSSVLGDDLSLLSIESSGDSSKKKRLASRLFRSPKRSRTPPRVLGDRSLSSVSSVATNHQQPALSTSKLFNGRAKLFLSTLNADFLHAMLVTPPELDDVLPVTRTTPPKQLPRLLVDISGDFAILLDRNQAENILDASETQGDGVNKRSNLLRLPSPIEPSGYCGSSEFREVLYLPARPEKQYNVDSYMSPSRSLLNLLYLYPRLLRISPDVTLEKKLSRFTVRIRILRTDSFVDDKAEQPGSHPRPILCFHNPAPWTGGSLLDSVYTKVAGDNFQSSHADVEAGLPIRDEIKVRLPEILDGNYRVEFTLYSVQVSTDSGITLTLVSDASIPLTSTASRDVSSGFRVATIIPNGKHRLELGVYQLQLETRLVSSIHVGDPAVATALRDLPYGKEQEKPDLLLGRSISGSSMPGGFAEVSPTLLATSSESTVVVFFQVLLYMHLFGLLETNESSSSESKSLALMMRSMHSLFEMLQKVKSKCLLKPAFPGLCRDHFSLFIKKTMDLFDESCLSESFQDLATIGETEETSAVATEPMHSDTNQSEEDVVDGDRSGEGTDETAFRVSTKSARQKQRDSRASRISAALGPSGIPFSRVAFGASKTDRMRAEAELRNDISHLAPFFDDDETIATAPSMYSGPRRSEAQKTLSIEASRGKSSRHEITVMDELNDDNSIALTGSKSSHPANEGQRSIGDTEFVKRVRTAASVMLAPCVGPSLSSILKTGGPSPRGAAVKTKRSFLSSHNEADQNVFVATAMCLCSPGSDAEDDNADVSQNNTAKFMSKPLAVRAFRGLPDSPRLLLSVSIGSTNELPASVGTGKFVYEAIMTLWLRVYFDHLEGRSSLSDQRAAPCAIPDFDPSGPRPGTSDSILSFFAHLCFLLPLCLKSIVTRYSKEVLPKCPPPIKVMADKGHMLVFEPFVEMLARGLIDQALTASSSAQERDISLRRAISSSKIVLDFLIGLLSVFHPEHMHILIAKYFKTLRDAETEHVGDSIIALALEWTEDNLRRVKCSRQLRLFAVETLAVLPSFLALNFPLKVSGNRDLHRSKKASWLHQCMDVEPDSFSSVNDPQGEIEKLPNSGWLAHIIMSESLSTCALSCESVVDEAIAHIEVSRRQLSTTSALKKRPGATLSRDDLLMFQSVAIHAINIVYELVIRRHAMDRRFQAESARSRIAALLAGPILEHSIASVRWLAKMEATHKVRSIWLLCFIYVLQEAPEVLICDFVRSCCNPNDVRIHRFIRLLRLCTATFQSFLDLQRHIPAPSDIDLRMSPWLLQESFNTICAASIVVVDVCVEYLSNFPDDQRKVMQGVLELLLQVLTTPQSSVTHLRAVGGVLQALEFDVDLFLEISGSNFQHWVRIILSLMNSVSLSVRCIAVDFVVSLLGSTFELHGNIDALSLVFASVLPEVVAREIALYSVDGYISKMDDIAKAVWPIRRSIADLGDTNPLDDDRVDPQLALVLVAFCRACQAIIDGVLVELRLQAEDAFVVVVGTKVEIAPPTETTFDADEESIFEAASFFVPETAPMQKIRWLLTLKSLHETKKHWVEAAEALFLCAHTICDAIPHLQNVWRPSRFALWLDHRRSMWLDTVGEEMGHPDRGNAEVMNFAEYFLEPNDFLGTTWQSSATGKLQQPTVSAMCDLLTRVAKDAVGFYLQESGMDELAYSRLEFLLKVLMSVIEDHNDQRVGPASFRLAKAAARMRHAEEEASLRRVSTSISGDMSSLAERLLSMVQNEPNTTIEGAFHMHPAGYTPSSRRQCYVIIRLYGNKPSRFEESTTIPTFLEWNKPCVCRVSKDVTDRAGGDLPMERVCLEFANPLITALRNECGKSNVILRTDAGSKEANKDGVTYLDVFAVDAVESNVSHASFRFKRFFHRKAATLVETTVANEFPCALSRQSSLLTTEIVTTKSPTAR